MNIQAEYLVDKKGHRKSVVLSLHHYEKLLEHLEDLEDAVDLKRAKISKKSFVDFDQMTHGLRKQGRIQ